MKKIILSIAAIAIFLTYVLVQRHHHDEGAIANSPATPSSVPSAQSHTLSATQNVHTTNYTHKDGTYTGPVTDAFYGNVQVAVSIVGGKITDVQFLQYPNDNPTSSSINQQAIPYLKQEALQTQTGRVDAVSGATYTSSAFIKSLTTALTHAS